MAIKINLSNKMVKNERKKSQIKRNALAVMFLTTMSRILGFVRLKVIALYFGASIEADIFNYVFSIPNNLRKIFAEGSLTTAFIPEFIKKITEDKKNHSYSSSKNSQNCIEDVNNQDSGSVLLTNFLSFQVILIGNLVVTLIIFSYPIMSLISGFKGESLSLASLVFSFIIIYIIMISVSSTFSGVLNAHNSFIIPALSPLLFSFVSIVSVILWSQTIGIYSVVLGVWLGGFLQVAIQIPFLHFLGYKKFLSLSNFSFQNSSLRRVLKRWFPLLGISLMMVIGQQVQFSLATWLEEGDVSIISSAIVFFQLPFGIFYASVVSLFFPKMSLAHLKKEKETFEKFFQEGFQVLLILLIPASLWLFYWAEPLLTLFLQGGRFNREDTLKTASLLKVFCSHLVVMSIFSFLLRIFYAAQITKIPFYLTLGATIGEVIFSLLTINHLGLSCIPWGTTVSYSFFLILGLFLLCHSGFSLNILSWFTVSFQIIIALIPTFFIMLYSSYWHWSSQFSLNDLLTLFLMGSLSIVSCIGIYFLLKVSSFRSLIYKL